MQQGLFLDLGSANEEGERGGKGVSDLGSDWWRWIGACRVIGRVKLGVFGGVEGSGGGWLVVILWSLARTRLGRTGVDGGVLVG
jgi:hypothetical protein